MIVKYHCKEYLLERGTPGASGYDLKCTRSSERVINPGERWLMPTGVHLEMPRGVEAQVRSRSGLSLTYGVVVLNAPGTIDSDFRGEVMVMLINHGRSPHTVLPGDRIAQLVFAHVLTDATNPPPMQNVHGEKVLGNLGPTHTTVVTPDWSWPGFHLVPVPLLSDLGDTQRGSGGHGSTGR